MTVMTLPATRVVGILGGMGPAAGADFVRLFVEACGEYMRDHQLPVCDQAYPEHWLVQVPVPDRTAALRDRSEGAHQPLEPLLQAVGRLAALGTRAVAIACNTAHAWHTTLQQRFPHLEVLNGVREVAAELARRGVADAGLLATRGTYSTGLYQQELEHYGVQCHLPLASEQDLLMTGIYQGVKEGNFVLARQCFMEVALAMRERHALSTLIMGCTEIPLAMQTWPALGQTVLVDPALVLARQLARRAYSASNLSTRDFASGPTDKRIVQV